MIYQINNQEKSSDNQSPETSEKLEHRKLAFKQMKKAITQQVSAWNMKYQQWDNCNQNIRMHRNQRMAQSFQIIMRSSMQQDNQATQVSRLFVEIHPRIEALHEIICNELKKKFFDFRFFQAFYLVLWQNICEKLWDQFYSSKFQLTIFILSGNAQKVTQFIAQQTLTVQKNHNEEPRFSDDSEEELSNKKNEIRMYELGKNLYIKNYQYNNYHLIQLLDPKYLNKFAERFNELPEKWRERLQFNFKRVFEENR